MIAPLILGIAYVSNLLPRPGVELLEGVDQPEHPVRHEVGLIHARGEAGRHAARDVFHQRGVVQDEAFACALASARDLILLELLPQPGELVELVGRRGLAGGGPRRRPHLDRAGPPAGLSFLAAFTVLAALSSFVGFELHRGLGLLGLAGLGHQALGWLCS